MSYPQQPAPKKWTSRPYVEFIARHQVGLLLTAVVVVSSKNRRLGKELAALQKTNKSLIKTNEALQVTLQARSLMDSFYRRGN